MTALAAPPAKSLPARHVWTCDQYRRMGALGFFDDERVELLDGEILQMPLPYPSLVTVIRQTAKALRAAFPSDCFVETKFPIAVSNHSEPRPSVTVVRGSPPDFGNHHPGPAEIALLVEVCDSNLRPYCGRKARAYARAGIRDYWIVNLVDGRLEVHRDPTPGGRFRAVTYYAPTEIVSPLALPDAELQVSDLLPPAPEQTSL